MTWETDDPDIGSEVDVDEAVLARRFNSNGAPAGDVFLVNAGDPDTEQEIAHNRSQSDDRAGIHRLGGRLTHLPVRARTRTRAGIRGHAFLATTDVVNGTAGSEFIQTFSLSETINGLAGNDTINGLGGNDIIRGGAGFDQLTGGAGNDQLFGEGGEDLLKGEDGDDLLGRRASAATSRSAAPAATPSTSIRSPRAASAPTTIWSRASAMPRTTR